MQKISSYHERASVTARDLLAPPAVLNLPPGPAVEGSIVFFAGDLYYWSNLTFAWEAISTTLSPSEVASLTSVGSGSSLVQQGTGLALTMRSLAAGPGVTLTTQPAGQITISVSGSGTSVTSTSPGNTIISSFTDPNLVLKSLVAGPNVTITEADPLNPTGLTLRYTGSPGGSLPSMFSEESGSALVTVGTMTSPQLGPTYELRGIVSGNAGATISVTPDGALNINSNVVSPGQIQVSSVGTGIPIPDADISEMPSFFFHTIAGETGQATVTATQTDISVDTPYTLTSETPSVSNLSILDPNENTAINWRVRALALGQYGVIVGSDPNPTILTPYVASMTTNVPDLALYTARFTYATNAPSGQQPSFIYERGLTGLILRVSQGTIGGGYLIKPLAVDFVTGIEGQAPGTRNLQFSFTLPNNFGWVDFDGFTVGNYRIPHVTWVNVSGSPGGLPPAFSTPTTPQTSSVPVFFPSVDPHRVTFDMSALGFPTTGAIGRGRISW